MTDKEQAGKEAEVAAAEDNEGATAFQGEEGKSESVSPAKMTLEEAIKQKLAQKKQEQTNERNKPKQSSGNMNLRNQNSNRNNALGRRNKV